MRAGRELGVGVRESPPERLFADGPCGFRGIAGARRVRRRVRAPPGLEPGAVHGLERHLSRRGPEPGRRGRVHDSDARGSGRLRQRQPARHSRPPVHHDLHGRDHRQQQLHTSIHGLVRPLFPDCRGRDDAAGACFLRVHGDCRDVRRLVRESVRGRRAVVQLRTELRRAVRQPRRSVARGRALVDGRRVELVRRHRNVLHQGFPEFSHHLERRRAEPPERETDEPRGLPVRPAADAPLQLRRGRRLGGARPLPRRRRRGHAPGVLRTDAGVPKSARRAVAQYVSQSHRRRRVRRGGEIQVVRAHIRGELHHAGVVPRGRGPHRRKPSSGVRQLLQRHVGFERRRVLQPRSATRDEFGILRVNA
mmetsp:Transcript_13213/g.56278  ORF Transcript_13213/g.56278 Transcript_13213/m.56278 type:complete len:364 (-) Transcript_13213:767-1858(-)